MSTVLKGPLWKKFARDDAGDRTYRIAFLVGSSSSLESFTNLLGTSGLPVPGDTWDYDGDTDAFAYCGFNTEIAQAPEYKNEKGYWWVLTYTFSTKVPDRCQTAAKGNPLDEPPQISISSVKATEEATEDRFDKAIVTSSHEPIKGPSVEFNKGKWQVKIVQNVAILNLPLLVSMKDTVNGSALWGVAPRCALLSDATAEKKYYGACAVYWTRTLTWEIDSKTFDKDALDEGNKVLHGKWDTVTGEWVVTPIGGLKRPSKPVAVATNPGGSLSPGTYVYAVTAVDVNGNETMASDAVSVQVTFSAAFKVTLSWSSIDGAIEYNVYGRSGAASSLKLIDTTSDLTYDDDGTVTPSGDLPTEDGTGTTPDKDNPKHFMRAIDRKGNVCRVVLNGEGVPSGVPVGTGAEAHVSKMKLLNATISNGGAGYAASDLLDIDGGTSTTSAQVTVQTTGANGAILTVNVTVAGSYSELPPTPALSNPATGTGSNATFDLDWGIESITVDAGGAGYTVAPEVVIEGGGGYDGASTATVAAGAVTALSVDNEGTGYSSIPTVKLDSVGKPGKIHVEKYDESDFTELDIPTSLEAP